MWRRVDIFTYPRGGRGTGIVPVTGDSERMRLYNRKICGLRAGGDNVHEFGRVENFGNRKVEHGNDQHQENPAVAEFLPSRIQNFVDLYIFSCVAGEFCCSLRILNRILLLSLNSAENSVWWYVEGICYMCRCRILLFILNCKHNSDGDLKFCIEFCMVVHRRGMLHVLVQNSVALLEFWTEFCCPLLILHRILYGRT